MSSDRRCRIEFSYRDAKKKLVLFENSFIIGRSTTLKATFDCHSLSREHLKVEFIRRTEIWVTDLGTRFGTFINGRPIEAHRAVKLNRGDQLHLGELEDGVDLELHLTYGETVQSERKEVEMFDPVAMEIDLRKKELSDLKAEVDKIENHIIEYKAEKKHAEELIKQIAEREKELDDLQKEVAVTEKRVAEVKAEKTKYETKLGPLKGEFEEISTKKAYLDEEFKKNKKTLLEIKEEIYELSNRREAFQEMLSESSAVETKLRETQEKLKEASEAELEMERNRAQVVALSERTNQLINTEAQYQKKLVTLKEELEKFDAEKAQLEAIRIKIQDREEKLKEAKLSLAQTREKENKAIEHIRELDSRAQRRQDEIETLEAARARLTEETTDRTSKLLELKEQVRHYSEEKKKLDEVLRRVADREKELEKTESTLEETRMHAIRVAGELDDVKTEWADKTSQIESLTRAISDSKKNKNELVQEEATLQAKVGQLRERVEQYETLTVQIPGLEKRERELNSAIESMQTKRVTLKAEIDQAEEDRKSLIERVQTFKIEKTELEEQIGILQSELEKTKNESEVLKRRYILEAEAEFAEAKLEKAQVERAVEELHAQKLAFQTDIQALSVKLPGVQATFDGLNEESETLKEQLIVKKNQLEKLNASIDDAMLRKEKQQSEFDKAIRHGHDELQAMKTRESEAFALWKADEEKKARDRLTQDVQAIAHQIANRVVTSFEGSGSISRNTLMEVLEAKVRGAISSDGVEVATYNPELKKSARNFWSQAAAVLAGVVALGVAYSYLPQITDALVAWKESRAKTSSSDVFVQQIRKAREEMMNLKLEPKTEFQEAYVDNILYNPGYLEMKESEELQRDWSIKLFDFFVAEKQDDRIVVDYITVEASLIRELTEERKIMNKVNFQIVHEKMKKSQKEKMDEIIKLVGGKETWLKIRAAENAFYEERVVAAIKGKTEPARSIASPDHPGEFNSLDSK